MLDAAQISMEQIWKEYHSKLLAFISRRVGDPSVADDILQEVFIKIHSGIGTLRSVDKLQSWIYRIARNAIIDHYRTHRPEAELPESINAPEADSSDKAREEIMDCLMPMIQRLPDPYREAVMLSEMDGLTQQEVASRQNLSLSGAKSRVQRGRALLKGMLTECCRFEFDHQGRVTDYEKRSCDRC